MKTDKHHLLWYKREYNKGWAKILRDHWYLRVEIPRDTLHKQIHCGVSHIPVPKAINTKAALEQLSLLENFGALHNDDPIDKRLMVLMAVFDCCEPATYAALKKQYEIVCKFYNKEPR